jgi:hypothetical protein
VLGPQEFAEGLAIGVHGFLGSAVGKSALKWLQRQLILTEDC